MFREHICAIIEELDNDGGAVAVVLYLNVDLNDLSDNFIVLTAPI